MKMKWPLSLFLFLAAPVALAQGLGAVRDNEAGIKHLKNENNYQAYQKFVEGLAKAPFQPELHLNLGLSFMVNEEWEKALKEFKLAERLTKDNELLQYQARFNAAQAAAQAGQIEEALRFYQAALDIEPNSQEVKTNIELMWKSQQGKGKGKNKNQQQNQQDGQNQEDQEQQDQGQNKDEKNQQGAPQQQKKQQPKPFDSRELTKDDVRKILEELKNQEQEIRAKQYDKGLKEAPNAKDW